ncbi:hypothetical protein N5F07_13285 [Pseudomonas chengduensis]|uniref:Uncharacterized protein n=1 Tax=Pseudomonas sihuiensis TaxID=1274359 RepID=A0A1H2M3A4_9PSED|nr:MULTISPECIES: hypothetical protein [Pseudomonas]MDH1622140.1 hypothetical protein [Pseudomonas chengduensis]MDH1865858.1 hypothetical protein [Pseudomonas chengduensis]SDU87743.1 hypothetical protein SAMN05216363_2708 [Pseudomonas sihuiensis]
MKVTALTLLILQINSLIDSGKYNDITISEVHEAIESQGLLRFIKKRCGSDIDLSIHLESTAYGNFEKFYEERINQIYGGYAGDEGRKWGVKNLGLCLVLAWTNEIIQWGEGLELSNRG